MLPSGYGMQDLEHLVVNNKIGHTDSPNSYYRLVDVLKAARRVRISRWNFVVATCVHQLCDFHGLQFCMQWASLWLVASHYPGVGLSNRNAYVQRHLRDLMEVLARYYLHRNLMNGFSNCEVKWYGYAWGQAISSCGGLGCMQNNLGCTRMLID